MTKQFEEHLQKNPMPTIDNNMKPYKIQGPRVYGNGQSYNCTNIVTAQTLQQTLNNLVEYKNTTIKTEQQLQHIIQQIIQLKLSINILSDEIKQLEANLNKLVEK